MKKVLSIIIVCVVSIVLVACGTNSSNDETDYSFDNSNEHSNSGSSSENYEWKQFLKEYEDWVDNYVEIVKKYKANPSDVSIMQDYTEMMAEMSDWSVKTAEMEEELNKASSSELMEYSLELARIAAKITQVAY